MKSTSLRLIGKLGRCCLHLLDYHPPCRDQPRRRVVQPPRDGRSRSRSQHPSPAHTKNNQRTLRAGEGCVGSGEMLSPAGDGCAPPELSFLGGDGARNTGRGFCEGFRVRHENASATAAPRLLPPTGEGLQMTDGPLRCHGNPRQAGTTNGGSRGAAGLFPALKLDAAGSILL